MERRKMIMGIIAAFFLATSTLGFVISFGSSSHPSSFEYKGRCMGKIKEIKDSYWLIYTLQDLNLPGERTGPYIKVIPNEKVRAIVNEMNLLFWRTATVDVNLEGGTFSLQAFVLGERNVGDVVLLDCDVAVQNGRVIYSNAIEPPLGG